MTHANNRGDDTACNREDDKADTEWMTQLAGNRANGTRGVPEDMYKL